MAGPFFIVDLSAWEGPQPNFEAIASTRDHVGCIIKATQGVTYSPRWFTENWPRVRAAGGDRYGSTWFRSCYHYAEPTPSGTAQADYLLRAVDRAGGWGPGDFPPAWDLEGPKWTSRQQIVDVSSQFSERIQQAIGKAPILYTGSVWRKFNVQEKSGFDKMWTPHMDLMARVGWRNESIVLHQYVGDGKYWNPSSRPAKLGYPTSVPGLSAKVDMNVVMDGGVPATSIERVYAVLFGGGHVPIVRAPSTQAPTDRGGRGISMPIVLGVGAGLLALGIMIASAGSDEAV